MEPYRLQMMLGIANSLITLEARAASMQQHWKQSCSGAFAYVCVCKSKSTYIMFTFLSLVPEIARNSGKKRPLCIFQTNTHTQRKESTFVFPDLYYQHGDDVPLSIKIQNNRKMPLRDKLIWGKNWLFFQLWDNSIRYISFQEYIPVIFEDFWVVCGINI